MAASTSTFEKGTRSEHVHNGEKASQSYHLRITLHVLGSIHPGVAQNRIVLKF